jgi:hypothetical protein
MTVAGARRPVAEANRTVLQPWRGFVRDVTLTSVYGVEAPRVAVGRQVPGCRLPFAEANRVSFSRIDDSAAGAGSRQH